MYNYVYKLVLNMEGKNNMAVEDACAMWSVYLTSKIPWIKEFITFCEKNAKEHPTISRDEWQILPVLHTETGGDLSKYEDDGSWPLLIDGFMEWRAKK